MTFAQKHLPFTQGHTHLSHTCPQILNLQLTIKALEGSGKGGLAPTTPLHREKERDMSQFSVCQLQNVRTKTRVHCHTATCMPSTPHTVQPETQACECTSTTPTPNYPSHISTCKCMTALAASHTYSAYADTNTYVRYVQSHMRPIYVNSLTHEFYAHTHAHHTRRFPHA